MRVRELYQEHSIHLFEGESLNERPGNEDAEVMKESVSERLQANESNKLENSPIASMTLLEISVGSI